jgi:poly-gamma-glutamate synthesis protein (capsule biosynthesis protein)
MTGRGIDQVLPHPSDPVLYERYVQDARVYVEIAEEKNGPISRAVGPDYIWGDALEVLKGIDPDVRIVNLETSVTMSDGYWQGKGINYRMHPKNVSCLVSAKIDCCALANNHVMDWGYEGLSETLRTLQNAGIRFAGAGRGLEQAQAPAVLQVEGKGRVLVFSFGTRDSGIPGKWASSENQPGVYLLKNLSKKTVEDIARIVGEVKGTGDVVIASIHWGGNWGYEISKEQQQFAHLLIDRAGVDLIHGHSSHHPKGLEVYRGKLVLYGCGDFLNDYEGIRGHERFRNDLSLMYFPSIDTKTGKLVRLRMIPLKIRRFRLNHASKSDARWLAELLDGEGRQFGTRVKLDQDGSLAVKWH